MKTHGCQIFLFLIVFILSSFSACEEPDPTVLPAETQSGKNTFGCYVNNELYVGGFSNLMGPNSLNATYNKKLNYISIESYGVVNNIYGQSIVVTAYSLKIDSIMAIELGYFYPNDMRFSYPYYTVKKSGEIIISLRALGFSFLFRRYLKNFSS